MSQRVPKGCRREESFFNSGPTNATSLYQTGDRRKMCWIYLGRLRRINFVMKLCFAFCRGTNFVEGGRSLSSGRQS